MPKSRHDRIIPSNERGTRRVRRGEVVYGVDGGPVTAPWDMIIMLSMNDNGAGEQIVAQTSDPSNPSDSEAQWFGVATDEDTAVCRCVIDTIKRPPKKRRIKA